MPTSPQAPLPGSGLALAADGVSLDVQGGADPVAIHTNVSGEINGITEKTVPVGADLIVIEDSASTNAKKKMQLVNAPWLPPLDRYPLDGTYGDHFTGASLSGSWTRRNYTGGAETYQVGPLGTYLRISAAGRTYGDGYYRPAPAGDWTFAMKWVNHFVSAPSWGIGVVDTNGNGLGIISLYTAPQATLLASVTTYSNYGGSYTQPGYGASPNITQSQDVYRFNHRPLWLYLRKSGTNYYVSMSENGEVWCPENSTAIVWAGTVDRVCMFHAPLSLMVNTGVGYQDIDWFNKIA